MNLPTINSSAMVDFLTTLLNTPSPTGHAEAAIAASEKVFSGLGGLEMRRTRKGGLFMVLPGKNNDQPRALTAHADTLGAMVKEIKSNGRLKLTQIGGYAWNTIEGEGCTVITSGGQHFRGSILIQAASGHVYGKKTAEMPREGDNMEVRLDERTASAEETRALGIQVGDFVAFDPRVEVTNGFIRSRHLDDKACVAAIFGAVLSLNELGVKPAQTTYILISNYEEVGHGASTGFPPEVGELVAVDMAAVGDGQTSDEFHATICVKDSGGPYHHGLSNRLRLLADQAGLAYKVDTYPYYGSDGEALWHAGADIAVALIGPGVDASHNYERTHTEALVATAQWLVLYLLAE